MVSQNTASGASALQSNTTGFSNAATGTFALFSNTTGTANTASGASALQSNTIAGANTATGASALKDNTTGDSNTATGYQALRSNITGVDNTATGSQSLVSNTNGHYNTANGYQTLWGNTSGQSNTAIGYRTLYNNVTGSSNVALGESAGCNQTPVAITSTSAPECAVWLAKATAVISGASGTKPLPGEPPSSSISAGKLGTTTSSRRFKDDIKPMNDASEALFALKPVTFRYKKEIDPQGIPQFGLIAEDVAEVNSQLVVRDKEGKVNTVRYEQINAMLLNEFLKEHKKVAAQETKIATQEATIAELKSTVARQEKGMETLTAQFKEQSAQLQNVSAQVRMSRPALRVVTNR